MAKSRTGENFGEREKGLGLAIKALEAKPDLIGPYGKNESSVRELIRAADLIAMYLRDGEVPEASSTA